MTTGPREEERKKEKEGLAKEEKEGLAKAGSKARREALRRWLDLAVSRDYTSLDASISSRQRAKSTKSQEQQSKERQCGAAAGGNSSKTRTHGLRHFVAYIRGRNWAALLRNSAKGQRAPRPKASSRGLGAGGCRLLGARCLCACLRGR